MFCSRALPTLGPGEEPGPGAARPRANHRRPSAPARTLHTWFDDESSDLVAVAVEQAIERRFIFHIARQSDDVLVRQHACEHRVHALLRVAYRHGRECVAVVAAQKSDEPRAT